VCTLNDFQSKLKLNYMHFIYRKARNKRKATPKRKTPGSKKKGMFCDKIASGCRNLMICFLKPARRHPHPPVSTSIAPISSSQDLREKPPSVPYSKARPRRSSNSSLCRPSHSSSRRLRIAWNDQSGLSFRRTTRAVVISWSRFWSGNGTPAMMRTPLIWPARAANCSGRRAVGLVVWRLALWRSRVRASALELVPPRRVFSWSW